MKSVTHLTGPQFERSLPSRERGLKCGERAQCYRQAESLPSRERGLKLLNEVLELNLTMSLPSRERGLKWGKVLLAAGLWCVAPLAGARIEILKPVAKFIIDWRRSPRGSAD